MDFKEFAVKILEFFIASLPILLIHIRNNKVVKGEVNNFGLGVDKAKDKIVEKFETKTKNLIERLDSQIDETIGKVDKTLEGINTKVEGFQKELESNKNQLEVMAKTNKASFEIISYLLSKDETLIANGSSQFLLNKLNMTKKELEEYPTKLSTDYNLIEHALKDQLLILGEENFNALIEKVKEGIVYENEERKTEEPQTSK